MDVDDALDAILELESLWRAANGRVTLAALGLADAPRVVRSRGGAPLPPERWRNYPGVVTVRHDPV